MIFQKTEQHQRVDFLQSFPFPVLIVTKAGLVVQANPDAIKLFQQEEHNIINRFWPGLDAQLTTIAWKKYWQELSSCTTPIHYKTDLLSAGSHLRPVAITLVQKTNDEAFVVIKDMATQNANTALSNLLSRESGLSTWSYDYLIEKASFSKNIHTQLGIPKEALPQETSGLAMKGILQKLLEEDSFTALRKRFKAAVLDGVSFQLSVFLKQAHQYSETPPLIRITGVPIQSDMGTTQVVGIVEKIDSQKEINALGNLAKFSLDNAKDMVFWVKEDGSLFYVNKTLCQRLGYTEAELLNKPIADLIPGNTQRNQQPIWKTLGIEKQTASEIKFLARSGKQLEVRILSNLVVYDGHEIACCYCRDITLQKLKTRRRELLELTLDSADDVILWILPDGRIRYANEAFLSLTEQTDEEIENQDVRQFFKGQNEHTFEELWTILRKEHFHDMEIRLRSSNNELIPYAASFNYINRKGEEFCAVFLRNIENKKQQKLLLKLSKTTLQNAGEIIVWLEESGQVQYMNEAALKYAGGEFEQWEGKEIDHVFPQLDFNDIKTKKNLEYSMPTPDGATVYFDLTFTKVNQFGESHYMMIGRNFTERYFRRQELHAAREKIETLSQRLQDENVVLRAEVNTDYGIDNIITVSPVYQQVLSQISQVADTDTTVLITGETGTGKELLARAVHSLSEREDHSLIKVNCAALPENLIESELFGHEKGAFTGATERKKGRFELANNGTLFLDEVGELPLALQVKLLRVLQEGEFERVGGIETIKVNTRLIAATNRSLEKMVSQGQFRSDLYYRLNVFPIHNIPLRDRPEDIPVLAIFFVQRYAKRQGKKIKKISAGDLKRLEEYRFPGNVRELENIIERAIVLCNGTTLRIPLDKRKDDNLGLNNNIFHTFDEMQRNHIIEALKRTNGRVSGAKGAGRLLGLNDRTLMSKISKFNIQKKEYLT